MSEDLLSIKGLSLRPSRSSDGASHAPARGGGTPTPATPTSATAVAAAAAAALTDGAAGDALSQLLGAHRKHVLVFSAAGKPVWSLHGDEEALAGAAAAAAALLSVVHGRGGQALRHVRAGGTAVAFLDRSPLCLLGASSLGEPPAVLRMQLALVHGQIVSLLTEAALKSLYARHPGYDARRLLDGSAPVLRALCESFTAGPAATLAAAPALRAPAGARARLGRALAGAVAAGGALFGLVLAGDRVAATASAPRAPRLQAWDVLLLANFLRAGGALRAGEALTPVCLPHFNAAGNLHAYVACLDAGSDTALVLLSGGGEPDLAALGAARRALEAQLAAGGALAALLAAAARRAGGGGADAALAPAGLPPEVAGGAATPLLHFAYRLSARQVFVASPFAPSVVPRARRRVVVGYGRLRAAMYEQGGEQRGAAGPLQRLRYERRGALALAAALGPEDELFVAVDAAAAGRAEALALAARLLAWLRSSKDF